MAATSAWRAPRAAGSARWRSTATTSPRHHRPPRARPDMLPALFLCIFAALGALARWRLSLWLNPVHTWIPLGTLAANLLGGWLIGLLVGFFQSHPHLDPVWRLALV